MKRRSLRIQITLAVGLIVTMACVLLTLNSIYSAGSYYVPYLLDESLYEQDSVTSNADEGTADMSDMVEPDQVTPEDLVRGFSVQGFVVMGLTIAASLLFTWWVTGRLLRPLEKLTEAMKTIDEGSLNAPLAVPDGTAEVRQLTESFNGMLRRLDESFQIQKRFTADAAHELKTPLAAIKTSLQVLELDGEPSAEEYREFAQDTGESLEQLIHTVEGLLALANGVPRQEREMVLLKALVEKVAESLSSKAGEKGITLSVEGEEAAVPGSPALFRRVIFNVVDNAVKYNRSGGRVNILLSREKGWAVVKISDTGIGIPAESLPAIFEPFYRADPSRSKEIEGSGLGLAIVRQIMNRYQGTVSAESTQGIGTTVTLRFQM